MIAARKRRIITPSLGFDAEAGTRGNTWQRACAGKERYTSEAAALAGIGLQLGKPLDTYHCAWCQGHHITERRRAGQGKAPPPVHLLVFVCSRCGARHPSIAASSSAWTPATRRRALLDLEVLVMADGWSIGAGDDHCASCASALGLETMTKEP